MWNTIEVLNILQAMVDKSGIVAEVEGDGGVKCVGRGGLRWVCEWEAPKAMMPNMRSCEHTRRG